MRKAAIFAIRMDSDIATSFREEAIPLWYILTAK
jgi:hypothetical protein